MLTYSQYLSETYKNLLDKDLEEKRKYIDEVWDLLQKSYAPIGGIKGNGFGSKEDLIEKIPFWKLLIKNKKVIVAIFYKNKGGRKIVAIGTDGSDLAKIWLQKIYKESLGVAYGEQSGPALAYAMKSIDFKILKNFLLTPKEVSKITGETVTSINKFDPENLEKKDKLTYDRFKDKLSDYFYVRELGGEMHLKVSFGTPNIPIFS